MNLPPKMGGKRFLVLAHRLNSNFTPHLQPHCSKGSATERKGEPIRRPLAGRRVGMSLYSRFSRFSRFSQLSPAST